MPAGRRLWLAVARRHRRLIALGVAVGLAWQGCVAAVPIVLGIGVDRGIIAGDRGAIWTAAGGVLALGVGAALFDAARHRWETMTAARVRHGLRLDLAASALAATPDERRAWPPAELVGRATADVDELAGTMESHAWLLAQAVMIPAVVAVLVAVDAWLAAAILVTVVAAVAITWRTSSAWERRAIAAQEAMAAYIGEAHGMLEGLEVIRGVGAEAGVAAAIERRSAAARDSALHVARLWIGFAPVMEVLWGIAVVAALWVGGERALSGAVGIGDVVIATGLATFLVEPMSSVGHGLVNLRASFAAAGRIAAVIDPLPAGEIAIPPVVQVRTAPAELRVDAVAAGFTHAGARAAALAPIGLSLRRGAVAHVSGPVGAGKSTLLSLLAGERHPTTGSVTVDGAPIADLPAAERHRRIAWLRPAPFLLAVSVADNLRLGRPDATGADLGAALAAAHATEIVDALPAGLATVLADRGASLSGGQRQRLALARALVAGPEVVLLDGALSGLEPALELAVLTDVARACAAGIVVVVSANPGVGALATVAVHVAAPVGAR